MSARSFMAYAAAGAVGLCLSAGLQARGQASGRRAPPYAGLTLHVLSFQDQHARAMVAQLPVFEQLTGAKVVFDAIAMQTVATKIGTDQAGGGSYDLYTVDEPYLPLFSKLLLPLAAWPQALLPDTARAGDAFLPAARAAAAYGGVSYGLPVNANVYMYLYRADLFRDAGEQRRYLQRFGHALAVPRTTEQLREVAAFFTRPPQLYGFAPFTKLSEGTTVEALWLLATFGVEEGDFGTALGLARTRRALQFYKEMMAFAPPGAANWHHAERLAAYSTGRLAQMMTWPNFLGGFEDRRKSLVVGRSGYGVPPAAAGGRPAPLSGSWIAVVPKSARQPALAAEFARWWASRDVGRRLIGGGMNPSRLDLLEEPAIVAQDPWFAAVEANFALAFVRPRWRSYRQLSDILSRHFTDLASGQASPEAAAYAMHQELCAELARPMLSQPPKVEPLTSRLSQPGATL